MPGVKETKSSALILSRCGGLVSCASAAWDADGRFLAVGYGRQVRLHEVFDSRGRALDTLVSRGVVSHGGEVVGVAFVGAHEVLSASRDGVLRVSDVRPQGRSRTVDVGGEVMGFAAPSAAQKGWDGRAYVAARGRVMAVRVRNGDMPAPRVEVWLTAVDLLACSADGNVVAAVRERKLLVAWKRDGGFSKKSVKLSVGATSVAVSPDGGIVAVGLKTGALHVYRGLRDAADKAGDLEGVVPSRFHWHSGPVRVLQFGSNGNVLMSGGTEAVLVSWKLTTSDFGENSFRPRLGGAIWGVAESPSGRHVALTCADNAVRILDSFSVAAVSVISGLAVPTPPTREVSRSEVLSRVQMLSLVPDPASDGAVLISGAGGSVQMFDVFRGEHVGFFGVVQRNQIHGGGALTDSSRRIIPVVRLAKLNARGDSMATIDVQQACSPGSREKDSYKPAEMEILRFWHRKSDSKSLELVARFENPHGRTGRVTAVEYHPHLPIVATASLSGTVRVWRLVATGVTGRPYTWRLEAERSYRGLSCRSLCFSHDGSLLAVAAGSSVALMCVGIFEPAREEDGEKHADAVDDGSVPESAEKSVALEVLYSLVHPPAGEVVHDVGFLNGEFPAVAAITKYGVYVWNLLSRSIWWSLRMVVNGRRMTVDPFSQRFSFGVDLPRVSSSNDARGNAAGGKRVKKKGGGATDKCRQETKSNGAKNSATADSDEKTDAVVLVFKTNSPIPCCVHRLPPEAELMALAFVPVPSSDDSQRKNSSPLVYLDGDLEMHMISDRETAEEPNFRRAVARARQPPARVQTESRSSLAKVLGADWAGAGLNASQSRFVPGAGIEAEQDVSSILHEAFAGETHLLPPITSTGAETIMKLAGLSTGSFDAAEDLDEPLPSSPADVPPREVLQVEVPEEEKEVAESPWANGKGRRKRIAKFTSFLEGYTAAKTTNASEKASA